MSKAYLGIDLGTSAVKVLCRYADGRTEKAREAYDEISPQGWYRAAAKALASLDTSCVAAVGLSSQVGTYIVNGSDVISWNDRAGVEELKNLKGQYSAETFLEEIAMPHPDIASYPIPRLMYIAKKYGCGAEVCQPKDHLGKKLTGVYATDPYSWRGLANTKTGRYSGLFLKACGDPALPPVIGCADMLGTITEEASRDTGLPLGTPVYAGLNDFFASLVGMGVSQPGCLFDITGTSEHLGVLDHALQWDTPLVAGPYLENYIHYGVTASSGVSLDFGIRNFGLKDFVPDPEQIRSAPIFLPYLKGERAPIFDPDARGVFFGICEGCSREQMAYSVAEGVVFSLYHIYEKLGKPDGQAMVVSGGAAQNPLLNLLKAELFGMPLITLEENDTSALGAAMMAAIGSGTYENITQAAQVFCRRKSCIAPEGALRDILLQRFKVYRELYPALKNSYQKLKEVKL